MLTDQWFVAMTQAGAGDASVLSRASRSRTCASRRSATGLPAGAPGDGETRARSCPANGCRRTCTGSTTSRTGASRASSGGATRFPRGTTRRATSTSRATKPTARAQARAKLGREPAIVRARRRRARHLVLARRCGAIRRSAGRTRRRELRDVPAVVGAGHRLRHHLLLGRAHDHDDDLLHRPRAVPRRLHQRARARRGRPEDVEVEGQRARSARPDRRRRPRDAGRQAHGEPDGPAPGRDDREAHAQAVSRTASRRSAPTRCASRSRRSRRSAARSTSTSTAARATATSATSCGTRRASC